MKLSNLPNIISACLVLLSFSFLQSCKPDKLFKQVSSDQSSIHFSNTITENDSINILDYEYVYNGGGVGIGDFNNDGLQDVYFTGNMVGNKLYLNKGDFKFDDITKQSGTGGENKWCTGVAVVDINADGWQDIYISTSRSNNVAMRENILYINKGPDNKGIPVFKNEAAAYGLADTSYSTQAAFFDYDNDGDLDMYLLVAGKMQKGNYPNKYKIKSVHDFSFNADKLYRNDWSDSLKHPCFTDVSERAGIIADGYGLGVNITDINKDGWKDIFVSNDYLSNDHLWINNHDGTFTDQSATCFKHTSFSAMGNDVTDLNNDGLADIIELDMNPSDNYRKKMMLNPNSYQNYRNFEYYGYQYEYGRNTLQFNQGPSLKQNDSVGLPAFSEVGFYSGIEATDWSWAPLVTDFDNDGYRDIIITNGFPRDLSDHDFITYRDQASQVASKNQLIEQLPEVKIKNYAYHNNANLTFTNVTDAWGITQPSFSNGAAYADLDNDGDLDYIINNINDEASVFENKASGQKNTAHYLQIKFEGQAPNINGVGCWVELHYNNGKQQVCENTPYRGYLSTMDNRAHFGLDTATVIDSVIIKWPDGKTQLIKQVKTNQLLPVKQADAKQTYNWLQPVFAANTLLTDITDSVTPGITHQENDFVDFNIQKLLPHKLSGYGPALAVGDINGDGLDDMVMGGSYGYNTRLLFQQTNGRFLQEDLITGIGKKSSYDMGILLFDADNDNDLDIYIAGGGFQSEAGSAAYADKLLINNSKGNFLPDSLSIPANYTSKSCVRAADFDKDGDLDLFIGGRCIPWKYPQPTSSFIYRNDSKNGKIKFTDITSSVAKDLINLGLTCDALWTDFDNDGWVDLIIAGEFMPIKFLKNNKGKFGLIKTTVDNETGWFNSIIAGDFDNDGDMDYIAGNTGQNSFYRPAQQYPVRVYAKDFDSNGSYDALPSMYLPTSQQDTTMREYPAQVRDDLIKQMIEMRRKFKLYKDFAVATFDKLLDKDQLKDALVLSVNNFKSCFIRNDGNNHFTVTALPMQAQLSPLFGMLAEDVDADGNLDVLINGNDYGTEVSVGRYDALNGLALKGDGKGNFKPLTIQQSGLFIPGNGRPLVKYSNSKGDCFIAAGQNKGKLKIIKMNKNATLLPLMPSDVSAIIKLKNGKTQKQEFNYGSSFLSQSGRFLNFNDNMVSVSITDAKGNSRLIVTGN